ncbi:cyclic di-GMP phosphodiesterase Gmr [mine drainage metagenome]|uniref:Cyclic di-GMP phosphodiesterase Gmr n=1 Tax=mine drainage metagenome TaxID=410659 RepID=A0A1J5S4C0_9ZZZZ
MAISRTTIPTGHVDREAIGTPPPLLSGKRATFFFAALACVGILNWLLIFSEFGKIGDAANVINTVGNLRILARNTEIHALQAASGTAGARSALAADRNQIDATLKALEHDRNGFGASSMESERAAAPLLASLRKAWSDHLAVVGVMAAKVESQNDTKARLRRFYTSGDYVVSRTNALIEHLMTRFDTLQKKARSRLSLLAAADLLFLIVLFMLVRARMVLSLLKLAGISGGRGAGRYEECSDQHFRGRAGRSVIAIEPVAAGYEGPVEAGGIDPDDLESAEGERCEFGETAAHGPVSIVISDAKGIIEYVSPGLAEISGYAPEEVIGKDFRLWQSGSTPTDSHQELWATVTAGRVWRGELLNKKKNGELYWEALSISAVVAANGRTSHFVAVKEDMTQHRKLQQGWQITEGRFRSRRTCATCATSKALQVSEERFRNLTELSSDWIWEQDEKLRYILCTDRNYDRESNELIGKTRWELPAILMSDADWAAHKALLEAHQPFDLEFQFKGKDGIVRWYKSSGMPILDPQGIFKGYRGVGKDITERKLAERQIEFLAYRDPLTGLPNRLLVLDRFEQAMAHADRTETRLALLFLDLDKFKTINDSLGHAVGDALLKEITIRLSGCVRDTDTISRQGGDEFLIVIPDLRDADDIAPVLVKIMERMQDPCRIEGNELTTSVSIGVALYPDDGGDFDALLKKADMAMYRAKDLGRNTYCFFDEQMNAEAVEHLSMRNGLRKALARSEFVLHYQPQIKLASGAVVGAEALIRWQHPELGMIPPARFIPVAEESGLIVPIGEWVVREACRQAMAWRQAGLPDLTVAVNLSAVQFKRGNLEQTVIGALEESGLDPSSLELELTESILLHDTESVLATVKRLKTLGVKLSIDDFGTGYSSLSYLKRFAVDRLKIDQSFIRDLATDPDDAAIVHAIIQMAHSLNLGTIAEGVENVGMLEQLCSFRCDEAQGFHFAKPMRADEFCRYLSAHLLA